MLAQHKIGRFSTKYGGSGDEDKYSAGNKRFLKLLDQQTNLSLVYERYQVPLPFRKSDFNLSNNRCLAMKCLEHLNKWFLKNETFLGENKMFINKMLRNEYAKRSVGKDENGSHHTMECIIQASQENSE